MQIHHDAGIEFIGQRDDSSRECRRSSRSRHAARKRLRSADDPRYSSRNAQRTGQIFGADFAQGWRVSATGMPMTARMPCSLAARAVSSGK